MDRLEASLTAVLGRGREDGDPSLAIGLIDLLAAKAQTGAFGNLGGLVGGGQQMAPAPYRQPHGEPHGGTGLLGGLGGLRHLFRQSDLDHLVDSWVGGGPNEPVSTGQLQGAIGDDLVDRLAQRSGLTAPDVLQRLTQNLPDVIDRLTPQGRLPSHEEASSLLGDRTS